MNLTKFYLLLFILKYSSLSLLFNIQNLLVVNERYTNNNKQINLIITIKYVYIITRY